MTGIWQFYSELYSSKATNTLNECMQVVPNLVTEEMNTCLMAPVTIIEVDKAVFSLGALKAPGPDGFNGLFFQKNWSIIRGDIFKVVSFFFETGVLNEEVNATLVALTPKIPMRESITHLRPTSCCNYLYKIIAKIFVTRLKPFMNRSVTPQQSAFVGGRLIQDNLILAHEAFHY